MSEIRGRSFSLTDWLWLYDSFVNGAWSWQQGLDYSVFSSKEFNDPRKRCINDLSRAFCTSHVSTCEILACAHHGTGKQDIWRVDFKSI